MTQMPTPKSRRYDQTINCGPNNPLTIINRGPVRIGLRYENMMDPKSQLFVEVRVGLRRQRTAFSAPHDHAEILKDVLEILGFKPAINIREVNYDDDYGEESD